MVDKIVDLAGEYQSLLGTLVENAAMGNPVTTKLDVVVSHLVVTMYQCGAIFWLLLRILKESNQFPHPRHRADSLFCLKIDSYLLGFSQRGECGYLPVVKATRLSILL